MFLFVLPAKGSVLLSICSLESSC